jgi:glycosyltransferase involved in cell wall biosynthesis
MLKISVIIITKNRPNTLIKTVTSLIEGKEHPLELIIVDSSENNTTKLLIQKLSKTIPFKFKYKKLQASGIAIPFNTAIRSTTGDIIAKIDDDEYADDDWILSIRKTYEEQPQSFAITGSVLPSDSHNYWQQTWGEILRESYAYKGKTYSIYGSNSAYRKEVFFKYDLFINEGNQGIAAEDSYISFMLNQKKLKIFHNCDVKVFHEFRNTGLSFARQWLNYGMADYQLWLLYPEIASSLSRHSPNSYRSVFSVARAQTRNWSKTKNVFFLPGFLLRNASYIFGAVYAFATKKHSL